VPASFVASQAPLLTVAAAVAITAQTTVVARLMRRRLSRPRLWRLRSTYLTCFVGAQLGTWTALIVFEHWLTKTSQRVAVEGVLVLPPLMFAVEYLFVRVALSCARAPSGVRCTLAALAVGKLASFAALALLYAVVMLLVEFLR